ncbi:LysM peptidoglycan-binding domain-containing protein [Patescibacteria group bacterium]|nr:LysM peptidoglycan-binding domain-containing protein [Patescibacteria group bacterium]
MSEMDLKNLIKFIKEKSTLIIFVLGFVIVMIVALNLLLSTLFKQSSAGKITDQVASTQIGFNPFDTADKYQRINSNFTTNGNQESEVTAYFVQPGDSLWKIALEYYSDPMIWHEIYELNKQLIGSDPNLIFPLTELRLPVIKSRL